MCWKYNSIYANCTRPYWGWGTFIVSGVTTKCVCERVTKWETNYWLFDPQYRVNNISPLYWDMVHNNIQLMTYPRPANTITIYSSDWYNC